MEKNVDLQSLHVVLAAVLVVIVAFSTYQIYTVNKPATPVVEIPKVELKKELAATIIIPDECPHCTNLSTLLSLMQENLDISFSKVETLHQSDAGALLKEHAFEKFPALILVGRDASLDDLPLFEKTATGYVFRNVTPPYVDQVGNIHGIVTAIHLQDATCTMCQNTTKVLDQLKLNGMYFSANKNVDISSDEGKRLVASYNISRVPTIILSRDALEYELVSRSWPDVGSIEADGKLVMRNVLPPFKDLVTKKVSGLVTVTYLVDATCTQCYRAQEFHRAILTQNFGMVLTKESVVESGSSEGKALIKKYNITRIPTVLLDKEAAAYTGLQSAWSRVGSIEADGQFVFRALNQLSDISYKDLVNDSIVST